VEQSWLLPTSKLGIVPNNDRFPILQINLKDFIAGTVIYRTHVKSDDITILLF